MISLNDVLNDPGTVQRSTKRPDGAKLVTTGDVDPDDASYGQLWVHNSHAHPLVPLTLAAVA